MMTPVLLMAASEPATQDMVTHILRSNVLNVVLVLLLLGFLAKKFNLLSGIDRQQTQISSAVESAEQQKQRALAQLEDIKRRTANLQKEVDTILNNAKTSAETMAEQIIADAHAESSKMMENLKKRMVLEQRAAIKTLEDRLLGEALTVAQTELGQSMTDHERHLSIEEYIDNLSQWQPPSKQSQPKGGSVHE